MNDDVERLAEIIALCKREGFFVSSVRVGSVEIKVAGRTIIKPKAPDESDRLRHTTEEESVQKKKMLELRKRSQEMFGKVLPDEALLAMDGVL
jgi:hypothetical protein